LHYPCKAARNISKEFKQIDSRIPNDRLDFSPLNFILKRDKLNEANLRKTHARQEKEALPGL
jgi:hypothetical protein